MTNPALPARRVSVAPMLDWTDRHCRQFHRLITRHTWLYTEMVTTGALLRGDAQRHLNFNPIEYPVAFQLGGSETAELAACAKMVAAAGYNEINLNCGCPSERVQQGAFGACLMAEPRLVADCFKAMQDVVDIPVTIKHRIGIDSQDSYAFMRDFVGQIADAGCTTFIVHARKAVLKGLSPRENREVPPLHYDYAYRLKREMPALEIILNGGVKTAVEIDTHLSQVDGVMIGREAYHNPYMMAEFDARFYADHTPVLAREQILERMIPYIAHQLELYGDDGRGLRLNSVVRHMLGLMQGLIGARKFRQILSDPKRLASNEPQLLREAYTQMQAVRMFSSETPEMTN